MSSSQVFSRNELRSLPVKHQKEQILEFITKVIQPGVLACAKQGKTQCLWEPPPVRHHLGGYGFPPLPPFTTEELIAALQEKFPDSTVKYQETWVETRPGVKEEQKGILIDWS